MKQQEVARTADSFDPKMRFAPTTTIFSVAVGLVVIAGLLCCLIFATTEFSLSVNLFLCLVVLFICTMIGLHIAGTTRRCPKCGQRLEAYSDILDRTDSEIVKATLGKDCDFERTPTSASILECAPCSKYAYFVFNDH